MDKARLAILIGPKGRGSNMRALVEACEAGEIPAEVALTVSPKDGLESVDWARSRGVRVEVLPSKDAEYAPTLMRALRDSGATYICLAGYLRLLPIEVLSEYSGRVLNIHPALLPKYGGKGMYGEAVHRAVLESGDKESGCTVHLVTECYDEGPIVFQLRCPVLPRDTPESLAARVLELEHRAYKFALAKVIAEHGL